MMSAEVVVISDSDGESKSQLTSVKVRSSIQPNTRKRPVKRLSAKHTKGQTRLDSFFHTLTIKNKKCEQVEDDCPVIDTDNPAIHMPSANNAGSKRNSSVLSQFSARNSRFPEVYPGTKRPASKGSSPSSKIHKTVKPKISELKGDELWKAVVAQRKKPKSLTNELANIDNKDGRSLSSSFDDFENLLITKQVVHSFPDDKLTKKPPQEIAVEECITEFKKKIPEVVPDEPVEDTNPIFRPRDRIMIKKKKKDCDPNEEVTNAGVLTSTPTKSANRTVDCSLDLFSDNSLLLEEPSSLPSDIALCRDYNRHVVVDCSVGDINTVMMLKDMNGRTKTCELQGFWADAPIKAGDIVNIFGEFDSNGYICVDMKQDNLIVVHPDFLVSGSVIASATTCVRRSVLGNRYKGYDAGNKYMLFGSILHEVFQKVLVSEIRDEAEMRKLAESIAHTSAYAHDMYSIDMAEKSLMEGIAEYIPPMSAFLSKHVGTQSKDKMKISCVRDIEETIWSPRFGMKGKIDVTVDCEVNGVSTNQIPLELKTGRPSYSAEHKGQVTIYSMMLSEKEQGKATLKDLKPGLLVYLKDGSMQQISHTGAAIRGLVNLRNELCDGLLRGIKKDPTSNEFVIDPLPEPINQRRMCETCPHLITCSLHQQVFKDFQAPGGHLMEELVPETLSHLSESHLNYFSKWSELLLIESSVEAKWKSLRDLWTKSTKQRLSTGTCITGLTVVECDEMYGKYKVIFKHSINGISTSKLRVGDIVVVGEENSKVIIQTTATILEINASHVTLYADRKFSPKQIYCIDKYDAYSGDGAGFTNLARLMENTPESNRLRSLLVDNKKPEFDDLIDDETAEKVEKLTSSLNSRQKHAVDQGLLTRDYLVIKGYPGTGKTSTIATLVESLRAQGMSVIVTSYTNSAVDNILLKLKQRNIEFIRLGRSSRVHPDIAAHSSEYLTKNICTVDDVEAFYKGFHVVGTTCLAVNHPMLIHRKFDVCILDEASQIKQPVSLGPLFYASRFILVGDTRQLPPLIRSNDARCLGMEETLLDLLDNRGATVELTDQYRMNVEIMRLPNQLTYENKLECGDDSIKYATVQTSALDLLDAKLSSESGWIQKITSSTLEHSLIWLNTSTCASTPSKKTTIHSNTEARVVGYVCQSLTKAGIADDCLGVITPYQAQVQLLKGMLGNSNIEVNTVDQYQGRDKSVVVISFARTEISSSSGKTEGILSDARRLNVALTRAKHKLILVGNVDVLRVYNPVHSLINTLHSHQIINLPTTPLPSESIS